MRLAALAGAALALAGCAAGKHTVATVTWISTVTSTQTVTVRQPSGSLR